MTCTIPSEAENARKAERNGVRALRQGVQPAPASFAEGAPAALR